MGDRPLDFQDVLQLVELMKSSSQFNEFKLRAGGIELELRRGPPPAAPARGAAPAELAPVPAASPGSAPAALAAPPVAAAPEPARPAVKSAAQRPPGAEVATAPMVGTVYLAPEPGARPFVEVGQAVEVGTQLCIVEVMKLMNAVVAGRKGVVSEILVADAETVEFGQPLFVITAS